MTPTDRTPLTMTFNDHLQHLVERALASIPAADAGDIYAVSFLIDNEDDDPRQPTLTIGYNTEAQARRSVQDASDQAEARWNHAFWIQNELTVVGDLTSDPAGATARQEWISDLGLLVRRADRARRTGFSRRATRRTDRGPLQRDLLPARPKPP
jgi:hypothetical protein